MKYFNSGSPLISQEEFDMLMMQAPAERAQLTDSALVSNWFLLCSAVIYIALLVAAQQNPAAAYNLSTIEMSTVYMTTYRIIYTLILAGIYFIGQNTQWHSEKIAYISFAMILNALLMELAFTRLPETLIEIGFLTIMMLIKSMVIGIFYINVKNKID
jgi:hypothetical protein